MMPFITDYLEFIVLAILLLVVVFIIIFIVMTVRYKKLRKSYYKMLNGTNVPDFEKVMSLVHEKISNLETKQLQQMKFIEEIHSSMKSLKARTGIHRYNAFDQQGNELSFSLAIVDEYQSGIVLTGLHSREESYMYAKPLDKGTSTYALSPEEKLAINQAANK